MSCPSEQAWLIAELGDVTVNEHETLLKHAQGCAVCRAVRERQRKLLDDLGAPSRQQRSTEDFLASVVARCKEGRAGAPASSGREPSRAVWPWLSALSVAAALALVFLSPSADMNENERFQARGGNAGPVARDVAPSADVFLTQGKTLLSLGGAILRTGDRLAVRVRNPGPEAAFLLAFAIDARGEVHWIFPAYVDEATNPESPTVAKTQVPVLLSETVELEGAAPGPLRVVSVVSRRRMTVKEVEARVAAQPDQPLDRLFSDSVVRQWKCEWRAR